VVEILGIVNVTRDSFSDGGRYLEPAVALDRAHGLVADGAAIVDVGAASTHPDSEEVTETEELRRLEPVVGEAVAAGLRVSVDTWRPAVMRRAVELGAELINDVRALAEPGAIEAVAEADCRLILMHSTSAAGRAVREELPADGVVERILAFFTRRLAELARDGIAAERVVVDPGMGFFLSSDPAPSLAVLRELPRLRALGRPVLVSTSRKSFLGAVLERPVGERGPGTLATELHAWRAGASYIRTHDVRALADAIRITEAIGEA
jgi:dihydropteroate synthase